MTQFYEKYKNLFDADASFKLPPRSKNFASEYNYGGGYIKPAKPTFQSLLPAKKPTSIQSVASLPIRNNPKPFKPINFDPKPRSRDPLKWNFSRGLQENKIADDRVFGKPSDYKSERSYSQYTRPRNASVPFATHGKLFSILSATSILKWKIH